MSSGPMSVRDVLAAGPPWLGMPAEAGMHRSVSGWGLSGDHVHLKLGHRWSDGFVEVETAVRAARDAQVEDRAIVHTMAVGYFVPFVWIHAERLGVAWAEIDGRVVYVKSGGRPIEDVELVRVDPEAEYEIHEDAPS